MYGPSSIFGVFGQLKSYISKDKTEITEYVFCLEFVLEFPKLRLSKLFEEVAGLHQTKFNRWQAPNTDLNPLPSKKARTHHIFKTFAPKYGAYQGQNLALTVFHLD